jgi:predicted secreted protein
MSQPDTFGSYIKSNFSSFPETYPDFTKLPTSSDSIINYMVLDPVLSAITSFAQATHSRRDLEHPIIVANGVHDFIGNQAPYPTYMAALAHDLPRRLDVSFQNARRGLGTILDNPNIDPNVRLYIASRLADQPVIEEIVFSQRADYAEEMRRSGNDEFADALTQSGYNKKIPNEFWSIPSAPCDIERMNRDFDIINITSGIIKAVEMLANMHSLPDRQAKVLRYIHDTETYYANFAKVLGYDGLSMALRSGASTARVLIGGEHVTSIEARSLGALIRDNEDMKRIGRLVFGDQFEIHSVVGNRSRIHSTIIGDWVAEIVVPDELPLAIAGAHRKKTVESIDDKLRRKGEVRDVAGFTAITNDHHEQIRSFAALVKRVRELPGTLVLNQENGLAFEIKGTKEFIGRCVYELNMMGINLVPNRDIEVSERAGEGFSDLKVMLLVSTERGLVPTEIRFTTKDQRHEDREGKPAHILFKGNAKNNGTDTLLALSGLHERRLNIQPDTIPINTGSIDRANELMDKVKGYRF